MTHVACRLTAKNRDQLRYPTLVIELWATFTVTYVHHNRAVDDGNMGPQGGFVTKLDATFCIIDNSRTRGHAYKLLKPHCTIDATKYFFSDRVCQG